MYILTLLTFLTSLFIFHIWSIIVNYNPFTKYLQPNCKPLQPIIQAIYNVCMKQLQGIYKLVIISFINSYYIYKIKN
jgi:hypothetical protein